MERLLESAGDESGAHTQQTDCSTSADVAQTETSMQNAFAIIIVSMFASLQISELRKSNWLLNNRVTSF